MKHKILFTLALLMALADIGTTAYALSNIDSAEEGNPFADAVMEEVGIGPAMFLLKSGAMIVGYVATEALGPEEMSWLPYTVLTIAWGTVTLLNLFVIV